MLSRQDDRMSAKSGGGLNIAGGDLPGRPNGRSKRAAWRSRELRLPLSGSRQIGPDLWSCTVSARRAAGLLRCSIRAEASKKRRSRILSRRTNHSSTSKRWNIQRPPEPGSGCPSRGGLRDRGSAQLDRRLLQDLLPTAASALPLSDRIFDRHRAICSVENSRASFRRVQTPSHRSLDRADRRPSQARHELAAWRVQHQAGRRLGQVESRLCCDRGRPVRRRRIGGRERQNRRCAGTASHRHQKGRREKDARGRHGAGAAVGQQGQLSVFRSGTRRTRRSQRLALRRRISASEAEPARSSPN